MQQKNMKIFIYPLISLGIFIVLVFGAAYAYIAGTITMNTSNYQVTLPQQTSLVCTKTDCGVTITPSQMARANNSTTAKSSNICSVNCTCSGAQGAVCAYNVTLVESNVKYRPSSSLGTNKEFTVTVSNPTGCSNPSTNNTTHYNSSVETQVNTVRSKIVSNCTLTVPQSGSISANVTAEFKWYNLNMAQDGHASKSYKYYFTTGDNLIPTTASGWVQGGINDAAGANADGMNNRIRVKDYISVTPNTTYHISVDNSESIQIRAVWCYKEDQSYDTTIYVNGIYKEFTTTSTCKYIRTVLQYSNTSTAIAPSKAEDANVRLYRH